MRLLVLTALFLMGCPREELPDTGEVESWALLDLPEPVDVVVNGGFEEGAEQPDQWTVSADGGAATRETGEAAEGEAWLALSSEDKGTVWASQGVSLTPGWPSVLQVRGDFGGLQPGSAGVFLTGSTSWQSVDDYHPLSGSSAWALWQSPYFIPSESESTLYLGAWEGASLGLDGVQVLQWDPSQIPGYEPVAHLTGSTVQRVEGAIAFRGAGTLAFPLPALHQGQVPLALRIHTEPEEALVSLNITEPWERDWVAEVSLDAPEQATLIMEAVVLEAEISDAQRLADAEAEERDPSDWLASTKVVQADDPAIVAAAAEAVGDASTDAEKLAAILDWLWDEVGYASSPKLDAVSVLEAGGGSCTGYANLAAALGRAAGIPTRVVAGYPAWGSPLQTHYIDEFYLDGVGWFRVEPQMTTWGVTQTYLSVVSIVHPEQEGSKAMDPWREATPGVPWLTLFEPEDGDLELLLRSDWFEDCPDCDHGAFGELNPSLAWLPVVAEMAEQGRARWLDFLDDAAAGRAEEWTGDAGPFTEVFDATTEDELARAVLGEPPG